MIFTHGCLERSSSLCFRIFIISYSHSIQISFSWAWFQAIIMLIIGHWWWCRCLAERRRKRFHLRLGRRFCFQTRLGRRFCFHSHLGRCKKRPRIGSLDIFGNIFKDNTKMRIFYKFLRTMSSYLYIINKGKHFELCFKRFFEQTI